MEYELWIEATSIYGTWHVLQQELLCMFVCVRICVCLCVRTIHVCVCAFVHVCQKSFAKLSQ